MLIGYFVFKRVFGYHPTESQRGAPVSSGTDKIMGPNFDFLRDKGIDASEKMHNLPKEEMTLKSFDGLTLAATYFPSAAKSHKYVLLIHGYNSRGLKDNSIKALGYLKAGYNVLLPDNRACGKSQGRYQTFGYLESHDVLLWINEIISRDKQSKIFVEGCSMGAATVCQLSQNDLPKNVVALVSDCSFADLNEQLKYIFKNFVGCSLFPLFYTMKFWCKKIAKFDVDDVKPVEAVTRAQTPMFFVHGKEDRYIPVSDAQRLFDSCAAEKKLFLVDNAGHAAACARADETYFDEVLGFVENYMGDK